MGMLCSGLKDNADQEIETHMLQHKQTDREIKKLLLLGSGSSGKSTLFKQLKCIFNAWGLDSTEYSSSTHTIRQNCVLWMLKLLQKSQDLHTFDPQKYSKCLIDLDSDANLLKHIQLMLKYKDDSFENLEDVQWDEMTNLGKAIEYIWNNIGGARETFNQRGTIFSFPDNMDYFFDKSSSIFLEEYYPSHEDVLKCRVRTTGMVETTYEIKDTFFNIYDVGGQRNERKKWIHSFEGVTAVIFVAALNHFDAVCFEDESQNGMHESIYLFREICNSKWFKRTSMILFLNKSDLFKGKLLEEINISYCFSPEAGWKGSQYDGPIYKKSENIQVDQEFFNDCYKKQTQFIQTVYYEQRQDQRKRIYSHITNATDRSNIEKVFWDVQNIIIRGNLHKGGFY